MKLYGSVIRPAGAHRFVRLSSVVLAALALVTCAEDPIGPARGEARLRLVPVFEANARLAPLAIDRVRVIVDRLTGTEEPGERVVDDTFSFALDQTQLTIRDIRVPMSEQSEDVQVTLQMLAGNTVLFGGSDVVALIRGRSSATTQITMSYQGPGSNVATLALAPRDTILGLGASFTFRLDAFDGQGLPVPQFYVSWSLVGGPSAGARINAAGQLTAPSVQDTFYVKVVNLPTGIADSTRVIVAPDRPPPPPVVLPAPLAAGDRHTCEIRTNGTYCWGANDDGQLGDGTQTDRLVPTPVLGSQTFMALSAGFSHTCALTAGGLAFCWGDNSTGALGDGTTANQNAPVAVAGGLAFAQIAAANQFTCGVTLQGQGLCWGANFAGQLGDGTTTERHTPTAVAGTHSFIRMTAAGIFDTSSDHGCGIDAAGQAWCWGDNGSGQLGDNSQTNSLTPVAVSGGLNFAEISVGGRTSCAITTNGGGFCWGFNFGAQLTTPTPVAGGFSYSALDMGQNHVCGLTPTGWVCGGDGSSGQLGDGASTERQTPVAPSGGHNFSVVAAGGRHTCGITSAGTFCWGSNSDGQLGLGDTEGTGSSVPAAVMGAPASIAISAGNNQTTLINTDVSVPPTVLVLDGAGQPVSGAEVVFSVTAGGGSINGGGATVPAQTGVDGSAGVTWTLGPNPGANSLSARVSAAGITGNPVSFTATAVNTAAAFSWTGAVSNDWAVAGNWSPAQVPGIADSVVIGAATNQPQLPANQVVGAVSIVTGGRLTINSFGLAVTRGLSTGGSGVLVMTNAADVVTIGGDARFDGGNELGLLSAGGLSIGGNLIQRATNSGDSFHPSGTHITLFIGTAPTIDFATPGLAPGTSHFQELAWTGGGTLTLLTQIMAHGNLTITGQTANTISSANGSRLTVGNLFNVTGLTFNNVPLTISQAVSGSLSLSNITFQAMPTTVAQLVISHPGAGTPFSFSNLQFLTTPVAPNGFYLDVTDVDGATSGVLTIQMVGPAPATPGAFFRTNGGAVVNWGGAATVNTWTGSQSIDWNTATNWSLGRVPSSTDSVVIPNGVTNFPTLSGRVVVGGMFEDGRLTINGGTLQVNRSTTSAAGVNRIILLTGATDSLIVLGDNGSPTSGTGGVVVISGNVTVPGNFGSLRLVLNGSGAQSLAGSGVANTPIGTMIVDKPAGTLTMGSALFTGDSIALLRGILAGAPQIQLTRGFSSAGGTSVNLTGSLQVGTNITVLGSYSVATTIFNLPTPQVISLPVLPYTNLTIQGNASGNSTASLTGRTVVTGNLQLGGNGGSPQMRLTLNGNTLVVGGSLTTAGIGGAMPNMTNPLDSLLVTGNATFSAAVGANPNNLTAGTLVVGGNFSQTNPNGGLPFQATGTHKTVLTGASPSVGFTSMGTAANQNRFASFSWTGTGTLSLADSGIVVSSVFTTTATAPVIFQGVIATSPLLQFGSIAAAGPVTFNRTRVAAVQTASPTQIGLGNATFTNLPTTVAQLTITHPGVAGGLTLPNLTFATVPTSGVYLSANDNAAADANPLVVNLAAPNPATSGGFLQLLNGATVVWPFTAALTWTGAVNTSWTAAGNWSGGVVPTAADSVVIGAAANQPNLNALVTVTAVVVGNGGNLNLGGNTLTVQRGFVTTGTGVLTSTVGGSALTVQGNTLFNGGNETGLLTAGTINARGNFAVGTTGTSFAATGGHTTFFNGTGAQSLTIPAGGPAGSRFQGVQVTNTGGAVTLGTPGQLMQVTGNLNLISGTTLTGSGSVAAGGVTTSAGSTLSVAQLTVPAAALAAAGTYTVAQTILTGGGTVPNLGFANLILASPGSYSAAGSRTITGNLGLQAGYNVGNATLTVGKTLRTTGSGFLTMTDAGSQVIADSAVFSGADETGQLSAGNLTIGRALVQSSTVSPSSLVATGGHTVTLMGPTVDVQFQTPDQSPLMNLVSNAGNTIINFVRVNGNLNANGNNFNAGTLNVRGTMTTAIATGCGLDSLILGSNLPAGNGYIAANHYVFDQTTGTQTIPGENPNLPYAGDGTSHPDVTVLSNAVLGGDLTTFGLAIGGTGQLAFGSNRATINGNFATSGSGLLVMTNPGDSLLVSGNVAFNGGLETGNLSDGTIVVGANFSQTSNQFRAQGNHRTVFTGPAALIGSAGVEPTFNDLVITGQTLLTTNTLASRDLILQTGARLASQTTQDLRGVRNVSAATGSQVIPFLLEINGTITSTGLVSPNNLVFSGNGLIPPSTANLVYQRIQVSNISTGYTLAGAISAPNGIFIAGPLTVGANSLTVNDLSVSLPTGLLIMTNSAGVVTVATIASFDGGDETGRLTAGAIVINGSMSQSATNSPNSFRASGTHSVVFGGTGASQMAFATPGSQFQNLLIDMPSGTATVTSGSVVAAGNLSITRGRLILSGHRVDVGGNFSINGSTSTLAMQNPADSLLVGNTALFNGASTNGLLTAGVLRISGDFIQQATVSTLSFAPSGTHKTVLGTAIGHNVSIGSPGLGAAGSHFQVLDVTPATGGVTLDVNMQADSLISTATAAKITSSGVTLTVRRAQVTGLTMDNTTLALDEQGTPAAESLTNVTFSGFGAIGSTMLKVLGPGNNFAARPLVNVSNMTFQSLLVGAGNFYVDLTSTNDQAITLTMTGSNQRPNAVPPGNGPALTLLTGLGATVNWP